MGEERKRERAKVVIDLAAVSCFFTFCCDFYEIKLWLLQQQQQPENLAKLGGCCRPFWYPASEIKSTHRSFFRMSFYFLCPEQEEFFPFPRLPFRSSLTHARTHARSGALCHCSKSSHFLLLSINSPRNETTEFFFFQTPKVIAWRKKILVFFFSTSKRIKTDFEASVQEKKQFWLS